MPHPKGSAPSGFLGASAPLPSMAALCLVLRLRPHPCLSPKTALPALLYFHCPHFRQPPYRDLAANPARLLLAELISAGLPGPEQPCKGTGHGPAGLASGAGAVLPAGPQAGRQPWHLSCAHTGRPVQRAGWSPRPHRHRCESLRPGGLTSCVIPHHPPTCSRRVGRLCFSPAIRVLTTPPPDKKLYDTYCGGVGIN